MAPFVEKSAAVVEQTEQKGTGHAVQMAMPYLKDYDGKTLILAGDMPLFDTTDAANADRHKPQGWGSAFEAALRRTLLAMDVLRDDHGRVVRIVEHKDATDEERQVKEVNASGILL